MTYEEARAFIDETSKYGYVFGLDTEREMLKRLGNPQNDLKFVHLAGTNGKGSTLAYISTILKEAGYCVGRYISPTVFAYRERIQVNEEYISEEDVARLAERVYQVGQEMLADGLHHPTAFEVETAMGFLYFKEHNCDIVVLETGLGGLTDATNVVETTILSVLVSISLDHMGFLGNTLGEIAAMKAGTIKPNTLVVSAPQRPEAHQVVADTCRKQNSSLTEVDPAQITEIQYGFDRQKFTYHGFKDLEIPLSGSYQIENAAVAVEAILALGEKGFPVSEKALRAGLKNTNWGARFAVVDRDPLFLVDGAHNQGAVDRLYECVNLYLADKRKVFIMGVFADKDYDYILNKMAPLAAHIVTVETPNNPRALPSGKLAEAAEKYNSSVEAADSLADGVRRARANAGKDDVILAFGSLSYLGELLRIIKAGKEKA